MALQARSPIVAMATNPLSQVQTARLLAAECYRLMSAYSLLCDEHRILRELADVEDRFDCSTARFYELSRIVGKTIEKKHDAWRQVHELGALPQASLSVFGTITCGERRSITQALEPQDFKDGAVLIKEGDLRDAFFIIVQGQVTCMQRRDHRAKSAPRRAALLECLSAPLRASAPRHARAPVLRPTRLCIAAREQERHLGPQAPRGFERSNNPRYSGADLAHSPNRPGLDETMLKRDCLLTNQPCELTVTAVGEVKVLVLHGARQRLADYRAWISEQSLAKLLAARPGKGPEEVRGPPGTRQGPPPTSAEFLVHLGDQVITTTLSAKMLKKPLQKARS